MGCEFQEAPAAGSLVCVYMDCNDNDGDALTALFEGLIRPVSAVSLLVAHFVRADALSTAALESVRTLALTHCRNTGMPNH